MARAFTGVTFLLFFASAATANIGPRWWGNYGSEPQGGIKEIAIARENLTIDLRPLITAKPVLVEAVYELYNAGPARKLDLLFVAGSEELSDFEVRLQDQLLESKPLTQDEVSKRWKDMPERWKPPRSIPGIERSESYPAIMLSTAEMASSRLILVAFTAEIPGGRSSLQARYRTRVAGADEGHPTATWQLPYILAPAREWKSFGGLEVTVYLPDGWQHASTPMLDREGNVLRGSFSGLPADALVVSTRSPVGPELEQRIKIGVVLFVFAVLGGGFLCWAAGRLLGRGLLRLQRLGRWNSGEINLWGQALAALAGIAWAAMICGTERLALDRIFAYLGAQESPYYHEHYILPTCGTVLIAICVVPLGGLLAWRTAASTIKRARRNVIEKS